MQDQWIEVVPLTGSPQAVMAEYCRMVNAAYANESVQLSKRWGTMMEVELRNSYVDELTGEYFAILVYELIRRKTREEFLEEIGEGDA